VKELPQGWVKVQLGELLELKYGKALPEKVRDGRGFPVFGSNGIVGSHSEPLTNGETLIVGRKGSVGEVQYSTAPCSPIDTTYYVDCIWGMSFRFWFYYLRHLNLQDLNKATAVPGLSRKDAYRLPIHLAPLNEQKRIVDKLDTLLARVDACRECLDNVPQILKRFRQAVLVAACSGRLTTDWRTDNPNVTTASEAIKRLHTSNLQIQIRRGVPETVKQSDIVLSWELPESWEFFSTAELLRTGAITDLKDGNHGVNHPKASDFTPEGLPFITAAQVNNFQIDYEGAYKVSGKPLDQLRVGFAKADDVIYTHKGSVGRVAISDRCCVLTPQTTYYRVNPEILSNKFVMYYLASPYFIEQVVAVKEQTTRDFVPISEQYLLFHRVPPLSEQYEIVRRIEALFKLAEQLEARYRTAKFQVERMTPALLSKAFCGELVPQNPNDEPASELLKRIKEQKSNEPEQKRKPRTNTIKNERNMNTKAATTLDELVSVLGQLGGDAMADRLVIESGLSDDIDRFFELLREGRNKFLDVPVGSNKPIRRIVDANQ